MPLLIRRIARGLALCLLVLSFTMLLSCAFVPYEEEVPAGGTCYVTLHPENGAATERIKVLSGERLQTPENPTKTGHLFDDWYTDEALTEPWDFSAPVTQNMDLYAGYFLDYATLVNRVSSEAVPATVTVLTECRTSPHSDAYVKTGSGVLIARTGNTYYLLTNNHVVCEKAGYSHYTYGITDCYGTTYLAAVVGADPDYDLALVSFTTSEREYPILPLAKENAPAGTPVVAIGQPMGQDNTVTLGAITAYRVLASYNSEDSNISFDVLWHDAPIASGSSGGPLLDSTLTVVGITFGEGTLDGEFVSGFSVPIEEVLEFLAVFEDILPPL